MEWVVLVITFVVSFAVSRYVFARLAKHYELKVHESDNDVHNALVHSIAVRVEVDGDRYYFYDSRNNQFLFRASDEDQYYAELERLGLYGIVGSYADLSKVPWLEPTIRQFAPKQ